MNMNHVRHHVVPLTITHHLHIGEGGGDIERFSLGLPLGVLLGAHLRHILVHHVRHGHRLALDRCPPRPARGLACPPPSRGPAHGQRDRRQSAFIRIA
jgi:hypothetical protein